MVPKRQRKNSSTAGIKSPLRGSDCGHFARCTASCRVEAYMPYRGLSMPHYEVYDTWYNLGTIQNSSIPSHTSTRKSKSRKIFYQQSLVRPSFFCYLSPRRQQAPPPFRREQTPPHRSKPPPRQRQLRERRPTPTRPSYAPGSLHLEQTSCVRLLPPIGFDSPGALGLSRARRTGS